MSARAYPHTYWKDKTKDNDNQNKLKKKYLGFIDHRQSLAGSMVSTAFSPLKKDSQIIIHIWYKSSSFKKKSNQKAQSRFP